MYKILHIMGDADVGGISSVVLNYYRFIDKNIFSFDFALHTKEIGRDGLELKKLGCAFYYLPKKSEDLFGYMKELRALLKAKQYDAIHVHQNETSYIALLVALKEGIRCRISHSHTISPTNSIKGEIKRLSGIVFNTLLSTQVVGCGEKAGNRVFGKITMKTKKAHILKNAIDTKIFKYSYEKRNYIRNTLNINDRYVVGIVGRLSYEKNFLFAIDLIKGLIKDIPNICLIIVGDGELRSLIEKKICDDNLNKYVVMLGSRDDVNDLYQMFDVLVMPSLFEGFPVVSIEAMSSGLPLVLSDSISKELSFYSKIDFLSIDNMELWANKIIELSKIKQDRTTGITEVINKGFDIRESVKNLEKIYMNDLN